MTVSPSMRPWGGGGGGGTVVVGGAMTTTVAVAVGCTWERAPSSLFTIVSARVRSAGSMFHVEIEPIEVERFLDVKRLLVDDPEVEDEILGVGIERPSGLELGDGIRIVPGIIEASRLAHVTFRRPRGLGRRALGRAVGMRACHHHGCEHGRDPESKDSSSHGPRA